MLPAALATLLEQLANMDVRFVLFGDWNQLHPPMNHWRADRVRGDALEHSRLLHLWAGGTEIRMNRCRRSSREFFDFCRSLLRPSLEAAVQQCRARFPPGAGPLHCQADMHLVLSHRRRRELNARCQAAAAARYKAAKPTGLVVRLEPANAEDGGGLNRAQPFDLFEGTNRGFTSL